MKCFCTAALMQKKLWSMNSRTFNFFSFQANLNTWYGFACKSSVQLDINKESFSRAFPVTCLRFTLDNLCWFADDFLSSFMKTICTACIFMSIKVCLLPMGSCRVILSVMWLQSNIIWHTEVEHEFFCKRIIILRFG